MGDGRLPSIALDGEDDATWITIPEDLLIPADDNPVGAIVSSTFPDLLNRIQYINYLKERCIMSPTNDVVDKINSHVLASMSGEMHKLLSADTICSTTYNLEDMQIMYPPEFLYTLRYKLVITVQDDGEEIECVLFNSEATLLLGNLVEELFYKTITEGADTTNYAIHDENLGSTISEYEEKLMDELEWGQDVSILKPAATHICTNEVPRTPDTSTNDFSVNDPNKGKSIVDAEPVVVETHLNNFTHDESLSLPELASDVNKDVSPLSSPTIEQMKCQLVAMKIK
ncbi:replication protein A 70 kDa DNA-binding subunit B [Tanacetum coccineum]